MRPFIASVLLLAACGKDLALPAAPVAAVPRIDAFRPHEGHAGTRVTVEGAFLGHAAGEVDIRFGSSAVVHPVTLAADGTRLEVDVPESASLSSPITVATGSGRDNSADSFTFLGPGRLLGGRISTSSALTPAVQVAFPAGNDGDLFVLYRFGEDPFGAILAARRNGATRITEPGGPVLAMAPIGDGARVGVFRVDLHAENCVGSSDPKCSEVHGVIAGFAPAALANAPYSDHLADFQHSFRFPEAFELNAATRVAFSPTGDSALAVAPGYPWNQGMPHAWFVDFTRSGTPALARLDADDAFYDPAWIENRTFLFGQAPYLRFVDGSLARPFDTEAAIYVSPQARLPIALTALAVHGPRAAVATAGGTLDLVDLSSWPPTGATPVDLVDRESPLRGQVRSLAFDAAGERLAIVRPDQDRVLVADVSGTDATVLSSVEVPSPRQVTAVGPYFYVGSPEGVFMLNARTGTAAGRFSLHTNALAAVRRRADCHGVVRDVLEVPLPSFLSFQRYDPASLARLPCPGPALAEGRLLQAVAAPAGGTLALRYDASDASPASLIILQQDTQDRITPTATLPASLGDAPVTALNAFPSPDGRFYYWLAVVNRDEGPHTYVTVVPAADDAPPTLPAFELDALSFAVEEAGDSLVILGHEGVRVLDLAAARQGRAVERHRWPWNLDLSARGEAGGVDSGRAWAVVRDDSGDAFLLSLSLADGTLAEPIALGQAVFAGRPRVVPGANRFWWLTPATDGVRLRSLVLDPHTGELLGEEPAVSLPRGAASLTAYPDGAHAAVIDAIGEKVLLLE